MVRIICIGNRFIQSDSLGSCVYDILSRYELPHDVELVEGGLAGLKLLSLMDNCQRVVFVDTILDEEPSRVQTLLPEAIKGSVPYGHSGGLKYLISAYQTLQEKQECDLFVVGAGIIEAAQEVAEVALAIACDKEIFQ